MWVDKPDKQRHESHLHPLAYMPTSLEEEIGIHFQSDGRQIWVLHKKLNPNNIQDIQARSNTPGNYRTKASFALEAEDQISHPDEPLLDPYEAHQQHKAMYPLEITEDRDPPDIVDQALALLKPEEHADQEYTIHTVDEIRGWLEEDPYTEPQARPPTGLISGEILSQIDSPYQLVGQFTFESIEDAQQTLREIHAQVYSAKLDVVERLPICGSFDVPPENNLQALSILWREKKPYGHLVTTYQMRSFTAQYLTFQGAKALENTMLIKKLQQLEPDIEPEKLLPSLLGGRALICKKITEIEPTDTKPIEEIYSLGSDSMRLYTMQSYIPPTEDYTEY